MCHDFSQLLRNFRSKIRGIAVSVLDGCVFIILLVGAVIEPLLLHLEKGKVESVEW